MSRHETLPTTRGKSQWLIAFTIWNVAVFGAWLVAPFALAGSAGWSAGWIHLGVVLVGAVGETLFVGAKNPELRARRARIGDATKPWDFAWNVAPEAARSFVFI